MDDWHPCLTCDIVIGRPTVPGREIYTHDHWWATLGELPSRHGWVVLTARSHGRPMVDLSIEEQASLGPIMCLVLAAMQRVLSPVAVHSSSFGLEGGHLRIHLVPEYPGDHLSGPDLVADMFQRQKQKRTVEEVASLAEQLRIACTDLSMTAPSHFPRPPRMPHDQSPTAPHIPHPEPPSSGKTRFAVEDDD